MQIECYRKIEVKVKKVEKKKDEEDEGRKILCKELGLLSQTKTRMTRRSLAGDYYPVMTKEEFFVWRQFLPTSYSKNEKEWGKYNFDIIPLKALEEISFAVSLRVFTDIEIWTPEENIFDPYIIGIVGSKVDKNITLHGITRWGESLKPFFEIGRIVLDKWQRNETKEKMPEKAQEYMDNYVINPKNYPGWGQRIGFAGSSFFKSSCCKEKVYKFKTHNDKHFVCSKCGKMKIMTFGLFDNIF